MASPEMPCGRSSDHLASRHGSTERLVMRTVAWDICPGGTTCGANERSMRTRE